MNCGRYRARGPEAVLVGGWVANFVDIARCWFRFVSRSRKETERKKRKVGRDGLTDRARLSVECSKGAVSLVGMYDSTL
jgi:hypothetical protein